MKMEPQFAFIGAGNMARAMIEGLITSGFSPQQIRAVDPSKDALNILAEKGVSRLDTSPRDLLQDVDLLILSVKPQVVPEVMAEVRALLEPSTPLLSIAAGVSTVSLQNQTGLSIPIIRCMPNLPAMIGRGASALFGSSLVKPSHRHLATQVMDAIGLTVWVEEETLLDAVTAVSGSGPAYFFSLIEAVIKSGTELGLNRETATALTLQTALGAAELATQSEAPVDTLRKNVASPGGTTERALEVLDAGDFQGLIRSAVRECAARSKELGKEVG